jgi:branched-chain amino acid transport system ATP-binding protein
MLAESRASALSVANVSVCYNGAIAALENVEMRVAKGGIVALLGPNGAGKTTLLKAVAGMLPFERGEITQGEIVFGNRPLRTLHPAMISKLGIALVQDGRQCFRDLTIEENLRAASFVRPHGAKQRLELVFSYFPFLHEMSGRKAGLLSGGQLQMLVIAMALLTEPGLLLLDEPSLGLSPVMVQNVFDVLQKLHDEVGVTMIVAEQTVPRLLTLATDVYVLSRGRVAMHARPSQISEEQLGLAYLN